MMTKQSIRDCNHEEVIKAKQRVSEIIDTIPPDELVIAIKDAPSLRGMILGYIAELKFMQFIKTKVGFTGIFAPDDHDRSSNKADVGFYYGEERIAVQLKSIQTNSIAWRRDLNCISAKVQNDGSDRRTVVLPNGISVETTNYKRGDYDILAVPLFPFSNQWNFAYMLNSECRNTASKKYSPEVQQYLLATTEELFYPLRQPWIGEIEEAVKRLMVYRKARTP